MNRAVLIAILSLTACDDAPVEALPEAPVADREAASIDVAMTLDKAVYTAKANTIRCITTPCPSNGEPAVAQVVIEAKNVGAAPVTLDFTSGQRFDLVILDESGQVAVSWAADKSFMQAMESVTIQPGQSEKWTAELPFAQGGMELSGSFTVRGSVLGVAEKVDVPVRVDLEGA